METTTRGKKSGGKNGACAGAAKSQVRPATHEAEGSTRRKGAQGVRARGVSWEQEQKACQVSVVLLSHQHGGQTVHLAALL